MGPRIETPLRPTWLRLAGIAAVGLVLASMVWAIIVKRYPASGGGDGPFFYKLIEAQKVSVGRWHELPLWNPYECGGVPLWDNPQSLAAAPLVLVLQPFNTTVTIGIWIVAHALVGFVGMWLLCRSELKTSRIGAFVGAVLFAFSVCHSSHAAGGHTAFVTFQYTPLALLLWRRGEHDLRAAVGVGLLFASMFYEGGVYAPAFIGLMLAIETLTRLRSKARALAILRAGGVFVVVAVGVGASRLLPIADQLAHYKRPLGAETEAIDWQMLKDMYLDRSHALRTAGHEYVWGEFNTYVGPIILTLALLGLVLTAATESWFAVVALAMFVLMLGHFAPWAPWTLLKKHVPPFISMRVPIRFRLLLIMFIAGWVAMLVDRLPKLVMRLSPHPAARAARVAILGIALAGAGDVMGHAIDVINGQWDGPAPARVPAATRFYLAGANLAQFIDQPRQNRGRLECWEEWAPHAGAPLWAGDAPQAKAQSDAATVYSVDRSQNGFVIDVEAKAPATILLNSSFARGWRTDVGTVRELQHQLVVDVPAGHHKLRVHYWPVGLTLGFFISAIVLAGAIFVLVRKRPLADGGVDGGARGTPEAATVSDP